MTDAETPRDVTRILRVKRKRNDDPVDAFLFQFHAPPKAKRRGQNADMIAQDPGMWDSLTGVGVFRRKETLYTIHSTNSQEVNNVIEAEWDAAACRVKLKRKHEEDEKSSISSSHSRIRLNEAAEEGMEKFSKLLEDYLHCMFCRLSHKQ